MKVLKYILSIILSFALMVGIIAVTLTIFGNRMLKKDYILAKFDEVDLYSQILSEVENGFENYIYQSGMEKNVITNICSKEKIENDIKLLVNSIYSDWDVEIDNSEIREKLDLAVDTVVNNQNRKISQEEEKNIENFKTAIIQSYEKSIGIYENSVDTLRTHIPKTVKIIGTAKTISIIVTIVIVVLLIVINIKDLFVCLNCIAISLISSGTILLLANNLINSNIEINNLLIFAPSMSSAVIAIINDFLNSVKTIGMWAILFGVLGILIISIKNMNRK